ncbi:ATP-binding protein [Streptomyces sp. NPDC026294]|uniref:AlbA family DNA-binding domain-containing protein n=1 Tax=Streptomyces sp. NPDC026294 TaxID=3155362 RepID=UPI0033C27C85
MLSWTRLHAHLDVPPGPIDFGMIRRATDDGLTEAEGLDWKEHLPQPPRTDMWCEFAKDVAAMANTAGGLLVYGVRDQTIELVGIPPGEAKVEQLRAWAHGHIQPFVDGLDFQLLQSDAGAKTVLVVHVPASPEAPHMVTGTAQRDKDQRAFFVPYRDDDETRWMGEGQIARAYRDRFQAQKHAEDELGRALDHVTSLSGAHEHQAVLIFAARPARPVPRAAATSSDRTAREILGLGLANAPARSRSGATVLKALGGHPEPQRGLRRWIFSSYLAKLTPFTEPSRSGEFSSRPVLVELHHDGMLVLSVNVSTRIFRSGEQPKRTAVVGQDVVEVAAGEVVSLIHAIRRVRVLDSSYMIVARLLAGTGNLLAVARHDVAPEFVGHVVPHVQQVETELPAGADDELRGEVAADLAGGILHQFGVETQLL